MGSGTAAPASPSGWLYIDEPGTTPL
jgi:hypothetical protein